MSPDEFDQILHDTEVKLARLRALFEQYFQGIEKQEPHVARKDMERALDTLRRNLPRNTALRFRMQQLAARYGTYLTYWQRIGRQIEEGTYRRDVMRAKRKVEPKHRAHDASPWEIDIDIDAIEESDFGSALDESDVDAILGALKPMSLAPKKGAPPQDTGSWASAPPPAEVPAAARSMAPRTGLSAFGGFGARPQSRGLSVAGPLPTGGPAKPTLPPVTKPAVAPPSTGVRPAISTPVVPAAVAPPVMARAVGAPPMVARPAAPVVARPAAPVVARPAQPAPSAPQPAARAPQPAAPTPVVSSGGVDGNAMRALYDRYADARRKNNEGAVRFETLHESVQKMVPKLREKYGDRKVDFEVVVQNGRVGLKPKATE